MSVKNINPQKSIAHFRRSPCPIVNTLDIVGDKWTLVVLRDLLVGKRRYGEFIASPEEIPTNILSERLKRLEKFGLLEKHAYQNNPTRYEYILTTKGTDILPVLQEMSHWGNKHVAGTWIPPKDFMERKIES
ncbi:helix-turn-helix transcriptional regulator [Desulfobacterota bacterium AH_259_B03_O07]|nr:helix-turn-helix transcriptional regulator [Desulfobacterota bacterium AH_259_B03_O07]